MFSLIFNRLNEEFFKLFSYGFIHFESVEKKDKFYKELKGKRVLVNEENKVIINFQLVKRNESRNKNVI